MGLCFAVGWALSDPHQLLNQTNVISDSQRQSDRTDICEANYLGRNVFAALQKC